MKNNTLSEYSSLEQAYQFFDVQLFDGRLPDCLIVLQRAANAAGYFVENRYSGRETKEHTHELALNPDAFLGRTDKEILSTLVHEQAHLWQCRFGNPSRAGYHNREWAEKMEALGLMPSDTGAAGGKRTGQRMTHYIIPGGRFDTATRELLDSGFKLNWESSRNAAHANGISKLKFTCPLCRQNAWAKPGARLLCGHCVVAMVGGGEGVAT